MFTFLAMETLEKNIAAVITFHSGKIPIQRSINCYV